MINKDGLKTPNQSYIMCQTLLFALFAFLAVSLAKKDYFDTTCAGLKTSKSQLLEVNRAKMLGLGNHSCIIQINAYNPDGTLNQSFQINQMIYNSYDAELGAVYSLNVPEYGSPTQYWEYADGNGNTCLQTNDADFSDYYLESIDQNKGNVGTVFRTIGFYTKNAAKKLRAIQHTMPTPYGILVHVTVLDESMHVTSAVTMTCLNA